MMLMRIVLVFSCLLALALGSSAPDVSAYWSPANGAFFFQATSGQRNANLVTIDTLAGLTDASCTAVVGRLSLTFADVQSAEHFAASIMPGIPLTSQKYFCADGSIPNVIYSGELVVEKESVSFATVRATVNDLFVASAVDFVALLPTTLLNMTATPSSSASESAYPLVQQVLQRPEWQSDELRHFLATGVLPNPGHVDAAANYDKTWQLAAKQTAGTKDLYGSPTASAYLTSTYASKLTSDLVFRFETKCGFPASAKLVVNGQYDVNATMTANVQKTWDWSFRKPLTRVTFQLGFAIEFGVGGSVHFDGRGSAMAGVRMSGGASLGLGWSSGKGVEFIRSTAIKPTQYQGPVLSGQVDSSGQLYVYAQPSFVVGDPRDPCLALLASQIHCMFLISQIHCMFSLNMRSGSSASQIHCMFSLNMRVIWLFLLHNLDMRVSLALLASQIHCMASGHVELRSNIQIAGQYRSARGACSSSQVKTTLKTGIVFDAAYFIYWYTKAEQSIEPVTLAEWKIYDKCNKLPGRSGQNEAVELPSFAASPAPVSNAPATGPFVYRQAVARGLTEARIVAENLTVPAGSPAFEFAASTPLSLPAATVQWTVPQAGDWAFSGVIVEGSWLADSSAIGMQIGQGLAAGATMSTTRLRAAFSVDCLPLTAFSYLTPAVSSMPAFANCLF
ncbi:hypothetical protein PAPYR_7947 [Paratrimastix pyriformis]|uniref:Uncharacterized protein n=1 Tax=Paratrimastix pyriformis TaxID=342808 RepID=A0ABQ8UBR6_9EUKA|nr:hypothetical protein PAPYR_7947 [Paratrimastix pyriformis]